MVVGSRTSSADATLVVSYLRPWRTRLVFSGARSPEERKEARAMTSFMWRLSVSGSSFALAVVLSLPVAGAVDPPAFNTQWGSYGSGDGQFDNPQQLTIDTAGNVYVADKNNHRIQKFSDTGTYLTKWGSGGSGDGQFGFPNAVAADSAGDVYVADVLNYR